MFRFGLAFSAYICNSGMCFLIQFVSVLGDARLFGSALFIIGYERTSAASNQTK